MGFRRAAWAVVGLWRALQILVWPHMCSTIKSSRNRFRLWWWIVFTVIEDSRLWGSSYWSWVKRGRSESHSWTTWKLERANDGRNPWGHINFWTASSFFRFLRENGAVVMQHHEHPAFLYDNTNPFDFSALSVKRTIKNLLRWIIPKSLYRIVYSTFLLVVVWGERN